MPPQHHFAVASYTSKPEASSEQKPESEMFIWRAEGLWEDTEPSAANLESSESVPFMHIQHSRPNTSLY